MALLLRYSLIGSIKVLVLPYPISFDLLLKVKTSQSTFFLLSHAITNALKHATVKLANKLIRFIQNELNLLTKGLAKTCILLSLFRGLKWIKDYAEQI